MEATRTIEHMDLEEEFEDGADGYALDKIMHSGDGHAITYDDLIMLPGYIDFGVADVSHALFFRCASSPSRTFAFLSRFHGLFRVHFISMKTMLTNGLEGGHDELLDTQYQAQSARHLIAYGHGHRG